MLSYANSSWMHLEQGQEMPLPSRQEEDRAGRAYEVPSSWLQTPGQHRGTPLRQPSPLLTW